MRLICVFCASWLAGSAALAQQVDYQSLESEGFGDIGQLYQSMSPEQQAEVMRQARIKQKELEKMTPQQRDALRAQLHDVKNTLYVEKVDPAKLDPGKSHSTETTQQQMTTYQRKYDQGVIRNGAVRSKASY